MAGCSSSSTEDERPREPQRITEEGLVEHLRALHRIASENGGERVAGSPGYAASVGYVAARLRRAGWRVAVQEVPMALWRERTPARLRLGSAKALDPERDFRPPSYAGAGRVDGALRSVGSGCAASDFAGLTPGGVAFARSGDCFLSVKTVNARRAGAGALLVQSRSSQDGLPSATLARPRLGLPVLLLRSGIRPREGERVRLALDTMTERGATQNVIAEAGHGERIVMAGAHLDSVPGGPGINDNGSGVATLLAAAEALGQRPRGRARVRLGFWGGEEEGLVGSRHYVRTLSRGERARISAYLNLDMVGSPNPLAAVYGDGDRRLSRLLRELHPGPEAGAAMGGRSDHTAFERAGIPASGLYTGAEERGPGGRPRDPCYHLPCDTLDNVDREALVGMARATAAALRRISARAGCSGSSGTGCPGRTSP